MFCLLQSEEPGSAALPHPAGLFVPYDGEGLVEGIQQQLQD